MRKIYNLLVLLTFLGFGFQANAQDCKKTCEVQKQVGEGVFLGVQIHSHNGKTGVHVVEVVNGTQAEAMKIEKGDHILTVNGVEMKSTPHMIEWVGKQHAGMPITVELTRNGKQITLTGKLGYKTMQTVTETICCDETIGQLELNKLRAYPNPSKGEFQLSFEIGNNKAIDYKLVDLHGNILAENVIYPQGGFVNERIVVSDYAAGDHVIVLSQEGKTIEKKVVLVK